MKRRLILVFILVLVTSILSGCTDEDKESTKANNEYKKVRLVLTVNGTERGIETLTARRFSQLVAEESGGNVVIEVYPDDELTGGNANEAVRSLTEGSIDMGAYVSGTMSLLDYHLEVAAIPWTFSSYQEVRQIIDDTGGDYYAKILSNYGLVYLGSTHNGIRQLANNRNPVRRPEDLHGMRMRVLGGEVYSLIFLALDAYPIPLSWSELNIALQQGVVEGQDNGFFLMRSGGLNEIQKYMTVWDYLYENYLFVINRKSFESLEPKTQELIRLKMREACDWSRNYLEAEEKVLRKQFVAEGLEIIELTPEEKEAFKAKVQPLREKLKERFGEEACAAFHIN